MHVTRCVVNCLYYSRFRGVKGPILRTRRCVERLQLTTNKSLHLLGALHKRSCAGSDENRVQVQYILWYWFNFNFGTQT